MNATDLGNAIVQHDGFKHEPSCLELMHSKYLES